MNKRLIILFFFVQAILAHPQLIAQHGSSDDGDTYRLANPVMVQYLSRNLKKSQPRLVVDEENLRNLRNKIKTDQLIRNIYEVIKHHAALVLESDLITLDIPDNPNSQQNQLGISRNFLYRINMLAMVYLLEERSDVLQRINDEVTAACNFPSWNPRHFLDVGEMSLAISLALDWTHGDLPASTIELAKNALINKGIMPSWPASGETPGWVTSSNNWNQVCNAGMIAASISVADMKPELAAKTIHRSIDGMNYALEAYAPDGVYPEGAIYWGYGTQFSVVTAAIFESAFGTDFGLADFPGFKESAVFRVLSTAPTNKLYNYADCGEEPEGYTNFTLSWFANKTGNKNYLNSRELMLPPEEMEKVSRLAGAGIVWTAQFEEKETKEIPTAWKGDGINPVVIFTGEKDNPERYYLGAKGGMGSVNHGNMDAGSFIFELDGVRWVIDPGNQGYGPLERAGFNLWGRCQECERWKLLTKNNFGHSTISVNDELHKVDGLAKIVDFKKGDHPEAKIDLTPTFEGQLKNVSRRFVKDSPRSLVIEDHIEISEATEWITWQLMTQADVEIVEGGAVLRQDGKVLYLKNLSHPQLMTSLISLDPPPLKYDKELVGLKRIEIRIPAWIIEGGSIDLRVQLSGEMMNGE